MYGLKKISHKGKTVSIVDLVGKTPADSIAILDACQKEIATHPPKSILLLTDVSEIKFSKESTDAVKNFASNNTPYVYASAVVGVEGMKAIILSAVKTFTGRKIAPFKTREEAMDWLVSQ